MTEHHTIQEDAPDPEPETSAEGGVVPPRSDLVAAGGVLATLIALAGLAVVLLLPQDDPTGGGTPPADTPQLGATIGTRSGTLTATATLFGLDAVDVSEEVTWPDGGHTRIRLAFAGQGELTGQAATIAPRVQNLAVDLDHVRVDPEPVMGLSNVWEIKAPTSLPPRTMHVTYQVHGVVVRTSASTQDGAVAVLRPLSALVAPDQSTVTVQGGTISNVYCPALPPAELLCGEQVGEAWRVTLPGAVSSPVLVQVDLPGTA